MTPDFGLLWARRIPTPVLVLGPSVTVALMLFVAWDDIPDSTSNIAELTSWGYAVGSITFAVLVVLLVTAWLAPRITGWLVLVMILPPVFGPTESVLAQLLWIPWASILIADVHHRWRQQTVHDDRFRVLSRPTTSVAPRRPLSEPGRVVISAVLIVGALGLAASWVSLWPELRASEVRSVTAPATVTTVEDGWIVADVEGETWDFWVEDSGDYVVGESYPVHVDPEGRFRPWNDYDVDQGYNAFRIDAAGGLAGLALLVVVLPRVRRRAAMLAGERAAVRCVVRPGPGERGLEILPVSSTAAVSHDCHGVVAWIPSTWHADSSRDYWGRRHVSTVWTWILNVILFVFADGAEFGERRDGSEAHSGWRDLPPPPWDARVRGMSRDGTCPIVELLDENDSVVATHVATRPVRGPAVRWSWWGSRLRAAFD